jgi:hypothetical protein
VRWHRQPGVQAPQPSPLVLVSAEKGHPTYNAIARSFGRQRRAQRSAAHLAGHTAIGIIARLGRVNLTAANPLWQSGSNPAGRARCLFDARAYDHRRKLRRAVLVLCVPRPAVGHLAYKCLVHQIYIHRGFKDRAGNSSVRTFSPCMLKTSTSISNLSTSKQAAKAYCFLASLMITRPPLAPGTAPQTASRLRSGSTNSIDILGRHLFRAHMAGTASHLYTPCLAWWSSRVNQGRAAGLTDHAFWGRPEMVRFTPPAKPLPLLTCR